MFLRRCLSGKIAFIFPAVWQNENTANFITDSSGTNGAKARFFGAKARTYWAKACRSGGMSGTSVNRDVPVTDLRRYLYSY